MPKIKLSVPHQLGQDEAKKRISKLIADTREQFGGKVSDVEESWNGHTETFRFRAMGFAVEGELKVQPADVLINVDLPFAALPFKGMVENEIVKHAKELLA
ncbi:MAG TPA: polyhydroxyalkanoic acid system family protein [Candidatus Saccharimonadales bacterium]|nr:polyhydroxyalkanoic acid system family protein [Candidatus Saccharimonadales bacterium]